MKTLQVIPMNPENSLWSYTDDDGTETRAYLATTTKCPMNQFVAGLIIDQWHSTPNEREAIIHTLLSLDARGFSMATLQLDTLASFYEANGIDKPPVLEGWWQMFHATVSAGYSHNNLYGKTGDFDS